MSCFWLDSQVLSHFQGSRDLHSNPLVSSVVDWTAWGWNGNGRQLHKTQHLVWCQPYHGLLAILHGTRTSWGVLPIDKGYGEEVEQDRHVQGTVQHDGRVLEPHHVARLPRLVTKTELCRYSENLIMSGVPICNDNACANSPLPWYKRLVAYALTTITRATGFWRPLPFDSYYELPSLTWPPGQS